MDSNLNTLFIRLHDNPKDDLAWQQFKRQMKSEPDATCCALFFGYLADTTGPNPLQDLLLERDLEIFPDILHFYQSFTTKTEVFGDIWGSGREFWYILQFLELWAEHISPKLTPKKLRSLNHVLQQLRQLAAKKSLPVDSTELNLPFLAQEVAWNLSLYIEAAPVLADYPEFRHMYFLPSELIPLCFDLENYKLSTDSEGYLQTLLHDTRKSAFRANLLNFAQTFPLILQSKWAYALYISLEQAEWHKHPFVRRILANSYWEARADGHILLNREKPKHVHVLH